MPTELISKIIESLPVAGAIIVIVWMFLQSKRNETALTTQALVALREALDSIAAQQLHQSEETNKILRENIKVQTEHVEILRELRRELYERRSV